MKLKLLSILIFLFTGFIFLLGCNKNNSSSGCPSYQETTYNIASLDRQVIPYKGNDTIKLLNVMLNQTAIFIGKGFDTIYTKVDESYDPGCPWTTVAKCQSIQTKYISANYSLPLIVTQTLATTATSIIVINFNNAEFSFWGDKGSHHDLDSLNINGKLYTNIYFIH
ncbi:MAG: hypothetical protein ACHQK8_01380, partial [Bacteroidia bacterium]